MRSYFILILFGTFISTSSAQFSFKLESGRLFSGYNDVKVPNVSVSDATLFSFPDDFNEGGQNFYFRGELSYTLARRNVIEFTAAPVFINFRDYNRPQLAFEDRIYEGDAINGSYQFNTYRLSYRYLFIDKPRFQLSAGATLLLRDAAITIEQGEIKEQNTDLGLVPLISFDMKYLANTRLGFQLKGDALVGPQGRAEDIFAGITYYIKPKYELYTGYRIIEGGADVDQVYNFALIHFAAVGFRLVL